MKYGKALTWDDLADEYKKDTGNSARTRSMNSIFHWAEKQTNKFYVDYDKQTIHKKVIDKITIGELTGLNNIINGGKKE